MTAPECLQSSSRFDEALAMRFLRLVDKDGPIPGYRPDLGPCWIWGGTHYSRGYGKFYDPRARKPALAHRVSFELFVGNIDEGLEIDHLCRIAGCVRPSHLEAVSHSENLIRAWRKNIPMDQQRVVCAKGHVVAGANVYRYTHPDTGRSTESCKECRRIQWREWNARRKAKRAQPSVNQRPPLADSRKA